MAVLRLEQLQERDRLYNLLNKDHTFTYSDYGVTKSYTKLNPFTNKNQNEVMAGAKRTEKDLAQKIDNTERLLENNMLLSEWQSATIPDSNAIGWDRIQADMNRRFRTGFKFPEKRPYFKVQAHVDLERNTVEYLKLVYIELFQTKQLTITSTYKEKLQAEQTKEELALLTLRSQLGLAEKELLSESLEIEQAKLNIQESHQELLTFNKLINKIEELHEPEPVKTGFHLESIDAKKLLVVGLALIGVVILLIVVKK